MVVLKVHSQVRRDAQNDATAKLHQMRMRNMISRPLSRSLRQPLEAGLDEGLLPLGLPHSRLYGESI